MKQLPGLASARDCDYCTASRQFKLFRWCLTLGQQLMEWIRTHAKPELQKFRHRIETASGNIDDDPGHNAADVLGYVDEALDHDDHLQHGKNIKWFRWSVHLMQACLTTWHQAIHAIRRCSLSHLHGKSKAGTVFQKTSTITLDKQATNAVQLFDAVSKTGASKEPRKQQRCGTAKEIFIVVQANFDRHPQSLRIQQIGNDTATYLWDVVAAETVYLYQAFPDSLGDNISIYEAQTKKL